MPIRGNNAYLQEATMASGENTYSLLSRREFCDITQTCCTGSDYESPTRQGVDKYGEYQGITGEVVDLGADDSTWHI